VPLLKIDGVLIWDDLLWNREHPAEERPESGIRLFRAASAASLNILHDGCQMIVIKTRDRPKTEGSVHLGKMMEKWMPPRVRKQIRKINRKVPNLLAHRQSTS
jgi:hypothetical protein